MTAQFATAGIPPPPPGFTEDVTDQFAVNLDRMTHGGVTAPSITSARTSAPSVSPFLPPRTPSARPSAPSAQPSVPSELNVPRGTPKLRPEFVFDESDPDIQAVIQGFAKYARETPTSGEKTALGRIVMRAANRFAGMTTQPAAQLLKFAADRLGLGNEFLDLAAKDLAPFIAESQSKLESGVSAVAEVGGTVAGFLSPASIPGKVAKLAAKGVGKALPKAVPRLLRGVGEVAGGISGFAAGQELPRALAEGENLLEAGKRAAKAPLEFGKALIMTPATVARIVRDARQMSPEELREALTELEPAVLGAFILGGVTTRLRGSRKGGGFAREPSPGLKPPTRKAAMEMEAGSFFREFVAQGESEVMRGHLKARVARDKRTGNTDTLDVFNRGAEEVIRSTPAEPTPSPLKPGETRLLEKLQPPAKVTVEKKPPIPLPSKEAREAPRRGESRKPSEPGVVRRETRSPEQRPVGPSAPGTVGSTPTASSEPSPPLVPVKKVEPPIVRPAVKRPPGEVLPKPKAVKQSWEITRAKFLAKEIESFSDTQKIAGVAFKITGSLEDQIANAATPIGAKANFHRLSVEKALEEGKLVPAEVLADYPNLKVKKPKAKPPKPATARPSAKSEPSVVEQTQEQGGLARLKARRFKTRGDEIKIKRLEAEAKLRPGKFKPGEGVGFRVASGRGTQITRGHRIESVNEKAKTAELILVADTGLADASFGDRITVKLVDLVRDRKFDSPAQKTTLTAPAPLGKTAEAPTPPAPVLSAIHNVVIEGKTLVEAAEPLVRERSRLFNEAKTIVERATGRTVGSSAIVFASKKTKVRPLTKRVRELDAQIAALEDRFRSRVKPLAPAGKASVAKIPTPLKAARAPKPPPPLNPRERSEVQQVEASGRSIIEDIQDPVTRTIAKFIAEETGTVDVDAVSAAVADVQALATTPLGEQRAGELGLFLRQFFDERVNVIRQTGPFGQRLANKIEQARIDSQIKTTADQVRLADAFHDALNRNIVGKIEVSRRALNAELGRKIEKGDTLNRQEKAVFNVWLDIQTRIAETFNAVGGRVLDPSTGPRKLREGWRQFWPQQLKDKILSNLLAGKVETTRQAAEHLVKTGQAKSVEEAGVILKELFDPRFNGYFAGLERPRTILWPEEWREFRADRVMEGYTKRSWRRIEEIRQFGQDGRGTTLRALLAGMRQEVPRRQRGRMVKIAQELYEQSFGLEGGGESLFAYLEGNFTTISKVGNILNGVFLQPSTFFNTVELTGMRNALKAVYGVAVKGDVRKMIRLSGIAHQDYLRNVADFQTRGVLSEVTRGVLTIQGTIHVDALMRSFNAQALLLYTRDAISGMRANPNSRAARSAGRLFERLHIPEEKVNGWVKNDAIPDEDILDLMIRGNAFAQFQADPLRRPAWAHSDLGRIMLRLKNFAFSQSRFIVKHVLGEAANGNFWPLLYALGGGTLFGEFYVATKNWFLGRDRRGKPVAEIIRDSDWQAALIRLGNDLTAAASFGVVSDALRMNETGQLINPARVIVPPVVSTMDNVVRSIWSVMVPSEKDADKALGERFAEKSRKLVEREFVGVGRAMDFLRSRGTIEAPPPFWNRKTPYSQDTAWLFDTFNRTKRDVERIERSSGRVPLALSRRFEFLKLDRQILIGAAEGGSNAARIKTIASGARDRYEERFGTTVAKELSKRLGR